MYLVYVFCFVLCCAEKEEGEMGVNYFKSFWVGTIVIEINDGQRMAFGGHHRLIMERAKTDEISVLSLLSSYL